MKIAIVTPHDYFHQGGVQEHVKAQEKLLREHGHDVTIISPYVKKTAPVKTPENMILVGQAAKMNHPVGSTRTEIGLAADLREIKGILEANNFDIIHFHEPWVPIIPRQILARSSSINVATFHAHWPDNTVNKSLEVATQPYTRTSLKYIDAITAVSIAATDLVSSTKTRKEIRIIPNGIDLESFDPHKIEASKHVDPDKKTILYIGRLEKRKGVNYLLKAYKKFANDGYELIIAGDGPRRTSLENYATTWELPNVKFLGFVDEDEKKALFKGADLFCSPAMYGESFGIVLLEAMAMGLPIVAGDNNGYRCVLKDVARIGLVDPKNTDDFAQRLQLLLEEPELRKVLQKWAAKNIKQYDYPVIVGQYEQLYEKLIKNGKKN